MKKILFFIALFYSFNIQSQTVQSSCTAPDSIYWKYRDDADKMAVRRVYHIGSTYQDSIAINKQIRDNYLRALIAVYNATAIPARDSVVKMLNIHIFWNNVNQISIRADSNLQWIKNIKAHVTPCGNTKMDYLMNKYYIKDYANYSNLLQPVTDIILQTDTNCNTQPLADTIKTISGIISADGATIPSDWSNKIEDSITVNYIWLVYSVGWDEFTPYGYPCPTGCPYRKFWQFRVYNDCTVEYGGTFGTPLDVGIKENIFDHENIKVYPNPTKDKLNIEFSSFELAAIKIELINFLGQVLVTLNNISQKQEINLNDFAPGFYFLKIQSGQTLKSFKIIRE